jgi:protein TonB
MFLGAFVIMGLLFILVLEVHIGGRSEDFDDFDDDIAMDLNIKPNDQRDMIAAAEKTKPVEQSEILNKVDNLSDLPPEILDVVKFQPDDFSEEELLEEEKEEPINQNADDPETLRMVQELPMYPGGMVEFMKWLTKNLNYPKYALRNKIQGKVMISFIVNTDGTISDIKVVKRAHALLDAEALRVARLMPKWEPGKDHGKVCRSMVAIPIVFEI